jgi:hypothetical protein
MAETLLQKPSLSLLASGSPFNVAVFAFVTGAPLPVKAAAATLPEKVALPFRRGMLAESCLSATGPANVAAVVALEALAA